MFYPPSPFTFLPLQHLVEKFTSTVNNQRPRIDQLDEDTDNLSDDIKALKKKVSSVRLISRFIHTQKTKTTHSDVYKGAFVCIQVDDRAAEADGAVTDADKTHKNATGLNAEVDKLRKKIQGGGRHPS